MRTRSANNPVLFWGVCLPLRLLLAGAAAWLQGVTAPDWQRRSLAVLLAVIGVGLIVAQLLRDAGYLARNGVGGQVAYWDSSVHGALYLLAAHYLTMRGDPRARLAPVMLLADVVIGVAQVVLLRPLEPGL